MTVRLKLFAILRDKAGVAELPLALPAGATVAHAIETLAVQHPTLRPHLPRAAAAVNLARAAPDTVLNDNDELALLPPVSGG
jgi:molybdopterin converting factor small subunit